MKARSVRMFVVLMFLCLFIPAAGMAEPSALVKTTLLKNHDLRQVLTAYGEVRADPDTQTSISVSRGGLIGKVLVRLGERVAAGTPLIELETAPAAHMAYQQAQAAVDYAKRDLSRLQRLYSEQLATNDQVSAARKALDDATAQLRAQTKVGAAQSREILRAPFDGVVTKLLVTQGNRVQADTTALIMARADALMVPLGIEPEDAPLVKAGMAVTLSSLFGPGLVRHGVVERVHAMIDPATRLVDVVVRVGKSPTSDLVLGMRVKGEITLARQTAMAVPRSAILRDDSGAYLYIVRDGHAHRVKVKTGITENELIAVSGNLKLGDQVVTLGNYELEDGMAVRVSGR